MSVAEQVQPCGENLELELPYVDHRVLGGVYDRELSLVGAEDILSLLGPLVVSGIRRRGNWYLTLGTDRGLNEDHLLVDELSHQLIIRDQSVEELRDGRGIEVAANETAVQEPVLPVLIFPAVKELLFDLEDFLQPGDLGWVDVLLNGGVLVNDP